MRRRVRSLFVCLLVAALLRPTPARASWCSVAQSAGGLGAGLSHMTGMPEWFQNMGEWWDNFFKAKRLLKDLKECSDAGGFSTDDCNDAIWAGACTAYLELGIEMAPEFRILGLPFEAICKGEPPLKCCKYTPDEIGCHTAFNSPLAINCETLPMFASTAQAFGPCVPMGDPLGLGCTCCGIGECANPACDPAELNNPESAAWRADTLAKRIAAAFPPAARANPDGALGFVTLPGCTAHRSAMLEIAPFAMPDSLPTNPDPGGNYHANDNNPDARYLRGLMTIVVRRILGGIPHGITRWQAISARIWTDEEIAGAAATVGDADAVLRDRLGDFGLAVLQLAEPRLYKLLAVPLPDEGPVTVDYIAACVPAQPPTVTLDLTIAGNSATAHVQVQDPLADHMPAGEYPASVDWGDGRLDQVLVGPLSPLPTHAYAAAGTYTVRALAVNTGGLVSGMETVAVVGAPEGPADPGPKTVSSIAVDLSASVYSYAPPRIIVAASVTDPAGVAYPVGHLYAPSPARPAGYATEQFAVPGTLSHFRTTPVSSLTLSSRWTGGNVVFNVQMLLGDVHLTYWDGSVTTVHLSPADVQWTPAGATSPVAALIDPATGALVLPAGSEPVTIGLSSSGAPFTGCRPLYSGPTPPAMITAGGGCQEQDTGRTWSLPSPPVNYAQAQAYCAGLTQGGETGWRLPTDEELTVATAAKAGTFFAFTTSGTNTWSSTSWFGIGRITRNLGTGGWGITYDSTPATAVCVR